MATASRRSPHTRGSKPPRAVDDQQHYRGHDQSDAEPYEAHYRHPEIGNLRPASYKGAQHRRTYQQRARYNGEDKPVGEHVHLTTELVETLMF